MDFVMIMEQMNLLTDQDEPYQILSADLAVDFNEDQNCQKYIIPVWTTDMSVRPDLDLEAVHNAFR